jgi:hypothetical protein
MRVRAVHALEQGAVHRARVLKIEDTDDTAHARALPETGLQTNV